MHVVFSVSSNAYIGPMGFRGSGENGIFIIGSWGVLVIILGSLRSKLMVFGIKGALLKSKIIDFKNLTLMKNLHFFEFFLSFLGLLILRSIITYFGIDIIVTYKPCM